MSDRTSPSVGVYVVKNTANGMAYVGSSANIELRLATHKSQLKGGKHPSTKLQAAWDEYGEGCFEFAQIHHCEEEFLLLFEQHFMDKLDATAKGYNTAPRPTARRVKLSGVSEPTDRALKLVAQGKMTAYAAAKKEGIALSTIYRALKRVEQEKSK